jgi:hypothetical protein
MGQPGYETIVVQFYVRNITLALPLTLLLLKLGVRFVTREKAKDVFRSILVLPLDLIYIAIGLLLAGMARRIPTFAAHYRNDKEADFSGAVLFIVLLFAACIVTWIDRGVRLLWQKFYAAWNLAKQMQSEDQQMSLPGQPMVKRIAVIYLWMFTYWSLMIPMIFVQAIIAVELLGSVLKRLQ